MTPQTSSRILTRIAARFSVMICPSCEGASRTLKNRRYTEVRRFPAGALCDGCQARQRVAVWLPDDSVWLHALREERHLNEVRRRDREVAARYS